MTPPETAWRGGESDDAWTVEIEDDRMDEDEPFVVTIAVKNFEDGAQESFSLACLTPTQAREIADALDEYALSVEQANGERGGAA